MEETSDGGPKPHVIIPARAGPAHASTADGLGGEDLRCKARGTLVEPTMVPYGRKIWRAAVRVAASPRRLALVPAAVALAVSACGTASPAPARTSHHAAPKVTIMARAVPGVGTVLVTARGYVLYIFAPDNRRQVTCTGSCAQDWPPVMLPSGAVPTAGPGVNASQLSSDPDPRGGQVVTYHGWPLYAYEDDTRPGQAAGQAIASDGGEWYVLRPSGAPLMPAPQA
jgi:predicted lipoprotein with Yx(FWY)xxD motif